MNILVPSNLVNDPIMRQKYLKYRERTGQVLPCDQNALQDILNNLHTFTEKNLMRINVGKTKVMLFNTSRIHW